MRTAATTIPVATSAERHPQGVLDLPARERIIWRRGWVPPGTVVNPAANAGYSASTSRIISARSTPGSIPAVRQAQV